MRRRPPKTLTLLAVRAIFCPHPSMTTFNPMAPEFLADPYPTYHRLRTEDPVH